MPLEKIANAPRPCLSSEHNPPTHMVYAPGTYRYKCPSCGFSVTFTVAAVY
jgi:transposase-like protein